MDNVLIVSPVISLAKQWSGNGSINLTFPNKPAEPHLLVTLYGGNRGNLGTKILIRTHANTQVGGLAEDQLLTAILIDPRTPGSSVACGPYLLADLITALPNAGSGGGGTGGTGTPATFSGNVKRVEDNIEQPAARTLVAIEQKNDSWIIAGHTTSDSETGDYQLDMETHGGDNFIVCMDDYGELYSAGSFVAAGTRIHPTTPNGFVYRVEQAGTLPETEPEWWIDTGTNHTRTVGDVTLRALPFFRPLCHGPVKPEQT